jgi:serine/threonine-protein kinase
MAFTSQSMPLSPGTRFGPYEIAALIGVGGMGEVYRAGDTSLKRDVAIKILPEFFATTGDWLARFQREAEMLAALNHQNIAHVYGLERVGTTTALVMELVDGPTLADRIAQGRVPLSEALTIARQIADALEAAHERGIVHRDLKPANIKLSADGTVKVLDFGIAKALLPAFNVSGPQTQVANTPTMTQLGMILGTAAYMSPEQARGKPVDKRTDVWAFGCVLYEMLAGKPAFEGEDATTTIGRVLEREADMEALPADVPPVVRKTLTACLQKDPKKRIRDIGDVKLALDGAFETHATPAHSAPGWRRTPALAAAFAVGAGVIALAAWRLWPTSEARAVTRLSMPISAPTVAPLVAISPDGERVAYRDTTSGSIYVRDLDAFDARPVAGTNGPERRPPCFSPDGTWIAYGSGGGQLLKKAPISGGAALTVAQNLDNADVCDWGDDGFIYFGTNTGIMRASEAGGPAELVAAQNTERGELLLERPHLLPGGGQVLFSVMDKRGVESMSVDVVNLSTRQRKTVLEAGGSANVVLGRDKAHAYLVYGLGGALFVAPFDLRRSEAGPARPVASDVASLGARSSAVVSASGTLAYLGGTNAALDSILIAMDRDGTEHALPESPHIYGEVSISPDGRRVATAIVDSQTAAAADLWTYDLDGERLTRLTFGGINIGAVWTPDSQKLIYFYADTLAATSHTEVRSVPADNSGPSNTVINDGTWMRGIAAPSAISADGKTLLVNNDSGSPSGDVVVVDLAEGASQTATSNAPRNFLATPFSEQSPAFSPNGRFVAYASNESGQAEIYVVPYPGPGGKSQVSRGGGTLPRWNRNGRELFYMNAGKLMSVEVETAETFRALTPRALFTLPPLLQNRGPPYDVMPDGQRFLLLKSTASSGATTELRFVVNWLDEVERTAAPERR